MEPVDGPPSVAELHDGDVLHRVREVHRDLPDHVASVTGDVVQRPPPSACVLVRQDGVQLAVAEGGLVDAHVRADILRKHKPLVRVRKGLPAEVSAQVFAVLALKEMPVNIVELLKRRG